MPHPIQPAAIPESDALNYQRIALPSANGIPHERGVRIRWQRSSVHEYLPVCCVLFVQHDDEARHLNDFEGTRKRIDARHSYGHATRLRGILSLALQSLFEERVGRRAQYHLFRLEILGDIDEVPREYLVLDTLRLALRVRFRLPDA